jgi:hypothetical protein
MPFSALGIAFITLVIIYADPKQFSFGIVWFLIASAKIVLATRNEKVKRSN